MLDSVISLLLEKSLDGRAKSAESSMLREALRERLAREVRLNLAMWDLPATKPQPEIFASLVCIEAFDAICTLNLPLRLILNQDGLSISARRYIEAEAAKEKSDSRFKQWTADINNEVVLVERIWHRLRVLRYRQNLNGSFGNLEYLMHLHRALLLTLQPG